MDTDMGLNVSTAWRASGVRTNFVVTFTVGMIGSGRTPCTLLLLRNRTMHQHLCRGSNARHNVIDPRWHVQDWARAPPLNHLCCLKRCSYQSARHSRTYRRTITADPLLTASSSASHWHCYLWPSALLAAAAPHNMRR